MVQQAYTFTSRIVCRTPWLVTSEFFEIRKGPQGFRLNTNPS